MKKIDTSKLNDYIFNTQVFSTIKYDGTNFGIDENKQMYGRNKIIPSNKNSYQKASLCNAKKIDTALIKAKMIE
jgi:hypothetical protein